MQTGWCKAASFVLSALVVLAVAIPTAAFAQVQQWNQVVTDPKLQQSMLRAVREVANEYVDELDEAGLAGAVAFIDTQLDYPVQLSSAHFRHNVLNALQAKAAYVIRYQAKSSAGVAVPLTAGFGYGILSLNAFSPGQASMPAVGKGEIPGDGAMMLCPINRAGLEFMSGVISIASLDANGTFRTEQDGADIIRMHDEILRRTYEYYGHTPETDGG